MVEKRSSSRIEGLDVLRGIAIALVLCRHSWPDVFGNAGIVGVVAFFTLSGYLITSILMRDIERLGRVRYGHFYRNRAIRLLPALILLLVVFAIVEIGTNVSGTRDYAWISIPVALTYTMNIPGFPHGSENLSHLWTLANEEQFYLVWPVLLLLAFRWKKLRPMVLIVSAVLLIALVGSIYVARGEVYKVYTLPTAWTLSMIIGGAAYLGRNRLSRVLTGKRVLVAGAIGLVVLIGFSFTPEMKNNPLSYIVGGPAVAVATVMLIWLLREWRTVHVALKPLLWLGTISYAAYLWNYPISWWLRDAEVPFWDIVTVLLTLAAATASWFAVESPMNRWKERMDTRKRASLEKAETIPPSVSAGHK